MNNTSIPTIDGASAVLSSLNQKVSTGNNLTQSEVLMGMTAAATKTFESFGPSPRDSQPIAIPLPESLKGAIASARG